MVFTRARCHVTFRNKLLFYGDELLAHLAKEKKGRMVYTGRKKERKHETRTVYCMKCNEVCGRKEKRGEAMKKAKRENLKSRLLGFLTSCYLLKYVLIFGHII
jgi:CO dehydrogenase/acetyl-CoA synthase alpha subunit